MNGFEKLSLTAEMLSLPVTDIKNVLCEINNMRLAQYKIKIDSLMRKVKQI